MNTERSFNLDFSRLAEYLPFRMRSRSVLALIRAAFAPYTDHLAAIFREEREEDRFRLRHNGQVCYLRAALNAKFRSSLQGVYFRIGEPNHGLEWLYAYTEGSLPAGTPEHTFALDEAAAAPAISPELESFEVAAPDFTPEPAIAVTDENTASAPPFNPPYAPNEVVLDARNSFIVYVPSDLYHSDLLPHIRRFVDEYRLPTCIPQYEPINS